MSYSTGRESKSWQCLPQSTQRSGRRNFQEKLYWYIKNTLRQQRVSAEQGLVTYVLKIKATGRRFKEANPLEGWLLQHTQKSASQLLVAMLLTVTHHLATGNGADGPSSGRDSTRRRKRSVCQCWVFLGRLTEWDFAKTQAAYNLWTLRAALSSRFRSSPSRQRLLLSEPFPFSTEAIHTG